MHTSHSSVSIFAEKEPDNNNNNNNNNNNFYILTDKHI